MMTLKITFSNHVQVFISNEKKFKCKRQLKSSSERIGVTRAQSVNDFSKLRSSVLLSLRYLF